MTGVSSSLIKQNPGLGREVLLRATNNPRPTPIAVVALAAFAIGSPPESHCSPLISCGKVSKLQWDAGFKHTPATIITEPCPLLTVTCQFSAMAWPLSETEAHQEPGEVDFRRTDLFDITAHRPLAAVGSLPRGQKQRGRIGRQSIPYSFGARGGFYP